MFTYEVNLKLLKSVIIINVPSNDWVTWLSCGIE